MWPLRTAVRTEPLSRQRFPEAAGLPARLRRYVWAPPSPCCPNAPNCARQYSHGVHGMNLKSALIAGALAVTVTQSVGAAEIRVLTAGAFKQVLLSVVPEY